MVQTHQYKQELYDPQPCLSGREEGSRHPTDIPLLSTVPKGSWGGTQLRCRVRLLQTNWLLNSLCSPVEQSGISDLHRKPMR